jgi:hypothetical protein
MLKERPPRAGFFEAERFQAVLRHLPPRSGQSPCSHMRRDGGYARSSRWNGDRWDLIEGSVRLDPGATKNGEGRLAYCARELLAVLRAQKAATRELEREKGIIVPQAFHRKGKRILRFTAS